MCTLKYTCSIRALAYFFDKKRYIGTDLGPGVALGPGAELDPDAAFTEIGTALDSFNLYPAKHLLSK